MYEVNFKCINEHMTELPEEVIKNGDIAFPAVHGDSTQMSKLAKAIREHYNDNISMVPFCLTVEAEAMGAEIKLGDSKVGPRVGNYAFNSIEELNNLKEIDLTDKRIKQVLEAVKNLNDNGEVVALSVQGPFTIMSSLMDPKLFFKAVRKNPEAVENFMEIINKSIVKYIVEGVERGAKIISYGDSAGTINILGPKMYKDYSGKYTHRILKEVKDKLGDSIIHLCGITSTSLHKGGFIKSTPIEVDGSMTYGQALEWSLKERKDIKLIGHYCIKKTAKSMKNPIIWNIELEG